MIVVSSGLGEAYTAFLSRLTIGELYAREGTLFAYVRSQWAQGRLFSLSTGELGIEKEIFYRRRLQ